MKCTRAYAVVVLLLLSLVWGGAALAGSSPGGSGGSGTANFRKPPLGVFRGPANQGGAGFPPHLSASESVVQINLSKL